MFDENENSSVDTYARDSEPPSNLYRRMRRLLNIVLLGPFILLFIAFILWISFIDPEIASQEQDSMLLTQLSEEIESVPVSGSTPEEKIRSAAEALSSIQSSLTNFGIQGASVNSQLNEFSRSFPVLATGLSNGQPIEVILARSSVDQNSYIAAAKQEIAMLKSRMEVLEESSMKSVPMSPCACDEQSLPPENIRIFYNSNEYTIRHPVTSKLNTYVEKLERFMEDEKLYTILITASADTRGKPSDNYTLAEDRANAVARFLQSKLPPRVTIDILPLSEEDNPMGTGDETEEVYNRSTLISLQSDRL